MKTMKGKIAIALCGSVMWAATACAQDPVSSGWYDVPPPPASVVAQPSADLQQLVAPIALYPDELVAQVLAAATYPTEITQATSWLQQNADLEGEALAAAVDQQPWDASVKALTPFPSVLNNMSQNLSWTSALGQAYASEPSQVMQAVQTLRARAQAAGTLQSTSQETVTTQGQTIVIEPADPQVVYVPAYDPWLAYGAPLLPYSDWVGVPGAYYGGPGLYFGLGLGIGLFAHYGWGWHHWGFDWGHRTVAFDHHPWFTRSPTFAHGFGHPGFEHPGFEHPGFEHPGFAHPVPAFRGAEPHVAPAPRPGAFSGFDHGGVTHGYSSWGHSSLAGGFHGGGFHGGGGGGHR